MKKRNLYVAAYLMMGAATVFTSCSNDDVIDNVNPGIEQGTEETQVLTLSVASSGDGLATRAGRPLYSNEAAQKVDYVALYFVDSQSKKIVLTKRVEWNSAKPYNDNRGHGKELEIALKGNQKLADGGYDIYAVGYSKNTEYTYQPSLPVDDNATYNADSKTSWNLFEVTMGEKQTDAEEIFAGSAHVTVVDKSFNLETGKGKTAITLHRQVAGITGYFKNIPVSVNGKQTTSIRLVSVDKYKIARLGNFYSSFTDSKDTPAKYIVNGQVPLTADAKYANGTDAHIIYSIDLNDWFVATGNSFSSCDLNGDGFIGPDDVKTYLEQHNVTNVESPDDYAGIWKNPYGSEAKFIRGSVFSGKFVIPFKKGDSNTLQLQLLDANEDVIKYWNINANEVHTGTETDETKGAWEAFDTDKTIYNIYRNHMYNVGLKANANPTNPDKPVNPTDPDPEQPDKDKDDPEDLSKGQDLILQVNDNWELIHHMELD